MRLMARRVDDSVVLARAASHYNFYSNCSAATSVKLSVAPAPMSASEQQGPVAASNFRSRRRTSCEQAASNIINLEGYNVGREEWEMSVQFRIEEMPGYLAARFVGAVTTEEDEQEFEL
jgi:hypothetical protein